MSSQWVNKYAIMRDLSLAQGCVPVDVAGTVEAGDRPPSHNLIEETEEEFYHSWVGGDGDFTAPDLGLIKHMLEVVRNHDIPSDKEDDDKDIIQLSKLNPLCTEYKPRALASGDSSVRNISLETSKKKKQRNVAIQSLLQNMKENIDTANNKDLVKRMKATDFNNEPNDVTKAIYKVSNCLEAKDKTPTKKNNNTLQLALDPSSMFKKKTSESIPKIKPVNEVKTNTTHEYGKFVPSNNAAEYYKKFLECSRMKQMVQDTVWTKVERQMKEIDERRVAEAELFALSLALCRDDEAPASPGLEAARISKLQKLDLVRLPRHRHELPAPCRACALRTAIEGHTPTQAQPKSFPTANNVDDNCTETDTIADEHNENVCSSWRNETKVIVNEHIKVEASWRNNNQTTVDEQTTNVDNRSRNHPKSIADGPDQKIENWRNQNKSIIDNHTRDSGRNESKTIVDEQIQSWRFEPKNINNVESYDDEDEIDAWRFEILGDENDEFDEGTENVDETCNLDNVDNITSLQRSNMQETNNIEAIFDDIEKWRSNFLSKNDDNNEDKIEDIYNKHIKTDAASETQQNCSRSNNVIDAKFKSVEDLKPQFKIVNNKNLGTANDGKNVYQIEIAKYYQQQKTNSVNNAFQISKAFGYDDIPKASGEYDDKIKPVIDKMNKKSLETDQEIEFLKDPVVKVDDDDDNDNSMFVSWRQPLESLDSLSDSES